MFHNAGWIELVVGARTLAYICVYFMELVLDVVLYIICLFVEVNADRV